MNHWINNLKTKLSSICRVPIVPAVASLNVAKLSRLRSWWLACRDIVPPSRQPSKHYLSLWDDSVRTSPDLAFWQCGKLVDCCLVDRQPFWFSFVFWPIMRVLFCLTLCQFDSDKNVSLGNVCVYLSRLVTHNKTLSKYKNSCQERRPRFK